MQPCRIDVHRHVIPSVYLSAIRDAGIDTPIAGVAYRHGMSRLT
jgi:hypothetical protein